jgi:prophage maintenance system killer protein
MDMYLEENGWQLTAAATEIDQVFRMLAAREMTEDDFSVWLTSRIERVG